MAIPRSATCTPHLLQQALHHSLSSSTTASSRSPCRTLVICHHVLRRLEYSRSRRMSSQRKMQTSTIYRPHPGPLDMPSPGTPPRNFGVPDTSIAGDEMAQGGTWTMPSRRRGEAIGMQSEVKRPEDREGAAVSVSLREEEAQKSAPPLQPPTSIDTPLQSSIPSSNSSTAPTLPATQPTARPRRFAFKPLKAALTLTPSAVSQMRTLLASPTPKLIRVGVKNKGCSGLAYHLEYVDGPNTNDETVVQDGVRVVIDSKALWTLIGSEMDWVEDKLAQRFVFRNPNIKEQCGCGESFMV